MYQFPSPSDYSDTMSFRRSSIETCCTSPTSSSFSSTTKTPMGRSLEPVSSIASSASALISYFWLSHDYRPATSPRSASSLKRATSSFAATPNFTKFLHDVLTTTQVSFSVVTMAILFIYRLKSRTGISAQKGSEYAVAIAALMLSNKICDDNVFTASTWAQVSQLALTSVVAGEREFLAGMQFQLHVESEDFKAWQRLLEGLGLAEVGIKQKRKPDTARTSESVSPNANPLSMQPVATHVSRSMARLPARAQHLAPLIIPRLAPALQRQHSQPAFETTLRKRSLPDAWAQTEQAPSKRFVAADTDNRPLLQYLHSFPTEASNSSFSNLSDANISPQAQLPLALSYYQLAGGQPNELHHQQSIPYVQPLLVPQPIQHADHWRNGIRAISHRVAASVSPMTIQQHALAAHTAVNYSLPYPTATYSQFSNAGIPGIVYSQAAWPAPSVAPHQVSPTSLVPTHYRPAELMAMHDSYRLPRSAHVSPATRHFF